jgi:pectate lyase
MKLLIFLATAIFVANAQSLKYDYRVLATTKTSTLEKEMNDAASAGFSFVDAMGGQSAFGGKEGVVVMVKEVGAREAHMKYKLLATNKTSTMEKEMQQLGDEGFEYKTQSVFNSSFGGQEVVVIMELDVSKPAKRILYKLLATNKTSTMQKELKEAGDSGFRAMGITVAKTAFGGNEVVAILRSE